MPKNSYQDRKRRLDRLIGLLKSREFWTTSELSRSLQISRSTLMRDLQEIQAQGIPIESDRGRGGGISLRGRYGLARLDLSHREVIDLLLALSTIEKLNSPLFLQDMKSIKDRIAAAFPESQRKQIQKIRTRLYIGDSASENVLAAHGTPDKRFVAAVHDAFFSQSLLSIHYTSGKKETLERRIEPHYLVLNWPAWYILAWDHLRDDVRFFRLDRISKAAILPDRFQLHHIKKFKDQLEAFSESI